MHLKILKTLPWKIQKFSNLLQSKLKNFVDIPWILLLFNAAQPDAVRIQVIEGFFLPTKASLSKDESLLVTKVVGWVVTRPGEGVWCRGPSPVKTQLGGSQAPA